MSDLYDLWLGIEIDEKAASFITDKTGRVIFIGGPGAGGGGASGGSTVVTVDNINELMPQMDDAELHANFRRVGFESGEARNEVQLYGELANGLRQGRLSPEQAYQTASSLAPRKIDKAHLQLELDDLSTLAQEKFGNLNTLYIVMGNELKRRRGKQ